MGSDRCLPGRRPDASAALSQLTGGVRARRCTCWRRQLRARSPAAGFRAARSPAWRTPRGTARVAAELHLQRCQRGRTQQAVDGHSYGWPALRERAAAPFHEATRRVRCSRRHSPLRPGPRTWHRCSAAPARPSLERPPAVRCVAATARAATASGWRLGADGRQPARDLMHQWHAKPASLGNAGIAFDRGAAVDRRRPQPQPDRDRAAGSESSQIEPDPPPHLHRPGLHGLGGRRAGGRAAARVGRPEWKGPRSRGPQEAVAELGGWLQGWRWRTPRRRSQWGRYRGLRRDGMPAPSTGSARRPRRSIGGGHVCSCVAASIELNSRWITGRQRASSSRMKRPSCSGAGDHVSTGP